MGFRDQKLVCEECGKTFFFTVTEQRRLAAAMGSDAIAAPNRCPSCRREQEPMPSSSRKPEQERTERAGRAGLTGRGERAERAPTPERTAAPIREQAEPLEVSTEEFPLEEEGIQVKLIGAVKWFNPGKGYGFITKADGKDVFFHRSDVVDIDVSTIQEGMEVEFQVRRTPKGLEAFNVSALPTS